MYGHNSKTHAGENWVSTGGSYTIGARFGWTARRIIVGDAGDLYLIPVGTTDLAGVFFMTCVGGEVIDQFCDGIGSSSTITVATAQQ